MVLPIDGQQERDLGEKAAHLLADRPAVLDGQEVVRRIRPHPARFPGCVRHRRGGKTGS